MPFGDPGLCRPLLDPDVHLKRTNYDLEEAARCIRATSYPDAEDFAARNVLKPPSEQEMLDLFTKAGLD